MTPDKFACVTFLTILYFLIGIMSGSVTEKQGYTEPAETLAVVCLWPVFGLLALIKGTFTLTKKIFAGS
jgi:hypothetical protein